MLIISDVVIENRSDDMGVIGGKDIPTQGTQGQPGDKEWDRKKKIRGDGAHAVRPIPLPNSMALGVVWADLYLSWDTAR